MALLPGAQLPLIALERFVVEIEDAGFAAAMAAIVSVGTDGRHGRRIVVRQLIRHRLRHGSRSLAAFVEAKAIA